MFIATPTQTMRGSLLMAMIWMLTTAPAIVRFRWETAGGEEDRCRRVRLCFRVFSLTSRHRKEEKHKGNYMFISCGSDKGHKTPWVCECVCVSPNTLNPGENKRRRRSKFRSRYKRVLKFLIFNFVTFVGCCFFADCILLQE